MDEFCESPWQTAPLARTQTNVAADTNSAAPSSRDRQLFGSLVSSPKKERKKEEEEEEEDLFHPRKFIKVEKDLDDSSLYLPEGVNYAQSGREVLNFERCDVSSDANKERGESSLCIRFPDV